MNHGQKVAQMAAAEMTERRHKGFTLIELLVVIVMMGVLAILVFPIFVKAREAARRSVCLSNVKNVALAIQMYLADNDDVLWPGECSETALDYFCKGPGGGQPDDRCLTDKRMARWANPYLRGPVILDEYVKSRDVWQCPSAKLVTGAMFIVPGPDWLGNLKSSEGRWGEESGIGPCLTAWPPGWGAEVTDSLDQRRAGSPSRGQGGGIGSPTKAFVQSLGTIAAELPSVGLTRTKMTTVQNPSSYAVTGDCGFLPDDYCGLGQAAWPDICAVECANEICGWADWEKCAPTAANCGLYNIAPNDNSFLVNPSRRTPYARHSGGVNIGFLDGHASWINSEALVEKVAHKEILGIRPWGPNTLGYSPDWNVGFHKCYPNVPVLF